MCRGRVIGLAGRLVGDDQRQSGEGLPLNPLASTLIECVLATLMERGPRPIRMDGPCPASRESGDVDLWRCHRGFADSAIPSLAIGRSPRASGAHGSWTLH